MLCNIGHLLAILLSFASAIATISPGNRSKKTKELKPIVGVQNESVFERDLVDEEPSPRDILLHNGAYHKETSLRHFNGTTLGYVTAWNSHGYDIAKIFGKKFDIISPVWLQIVPKGEAYELAGTHDIDAGWLNDVRRNSKILPRVLFDKFAERDLSRLLSVKKQRSEVNELLVAACSKYGFNGVVLEVWSLAGRVDDEFLIELVLDMAHALKKSNFQLILVIPPSRPDAMDLFRPEHMTQLYKHVYAFSLMTYDYSNVQRPGANAPLHWMRQAVEKIAPLKSHDVKTKRRKILMGLNMYGNDYTPDGGGPIVGSQYLNLLRNVKKRLAHNDQSVENFFEVKTDTGRHYVFYPTLHSINERIKLAQELGVGLSLWELGQGLDYFYDLF